ncbi:MAG: NAD(P)-dependent oxidoreductase [Acidobacteriota bacterium]
MVVIDTALEQRHREGRPVRVGMVGAGYMARGIALSILQAPPGMKLVAVANRTISEAVRVYREAGMEEIVFADSSDKLGEALQVGKCAVTDNALLVCEAEGVDAIIEVTGEIEFGSVVALRAFEFGKHVILMNAELDATLGPILKVYADRQNVVFTNTDGDEPGVAMNLYRFVNSIGYQPVAAGNIKGFIDPYRTPDTQREFAARHQQKPRMITSFADGTKLSMEATILANATGFRVGKRGMYGPRCKDVREVAQLLPAEQLLATGLVDYVLGAEPGTGAFVIGYNTQPALQQYMRYFKMGEGPFYVFYTPYHLPHLQLPLSVARAVLFRDPTVTPSGVPRCDVISVAKRDLRAGEVLDGIGGFTCYGTIENFEASCEKDLLPMGLSQDCRLVRDIKKDTALSYADVVLPENRVSDRLRSELLSHFGFRSGLQTPA